MRADRPPKVLVVGHNVRHIACSAARAGFVVLAADCYRDLDLAESVSKSFLLDCDPSISGDIVKSAEKLIRTVLDRDSVPGYGVVSVAVKADLENRAVGKPIGSNGFVQFDTKPSIGGIQFSEVLYFVPDFAILADGYTIKVGSSYEWLQWRTMRSLAVFPGPKG